MACGLGFSEESAMHKTTSYDVYKDGKLISSETRTVYDEEQPKTQAGDSHHRGSAREHATDHRHDHSHKPK
jgi:hypothetical protein